MTTEAVIYQPDNKFFIHRLNGRLIHCQPKRALQYSKNPFRFREISAEQHQAMRQAYARENQSLLKYVGIHKNKTIHVFGNGPSLNDFAKDRDWSNDITIGVNAAGYTVNTMNYWISVDNLWDKRGARDLHFWVWEYLRKVQGKTKIFVRRGTTIDLQLTPRNENAEKELFIPDEIFTHAPKPEDTPVKGLYYHRSSVNAAIELARHMGAKKIVCWGLDYKDRSHSYTGSVAIPKDMKDEPGKRWADMHAVEYGFETCLKACKKAGCQLVNANPDSALKALPLEHPEMIFSGDLVA